MGRIRSEFTHLGEGEGGAVLEWRSRGQLVDGEPIQYSGVSLLELDGGRVGRFRTSDDSAVFLPGGARQVQRSEGDSPVPDRRAAVTNPSADSP